MTRLKGWARDGLTDEQIAKNAGVAYSTFRDWMGRFPALSAAIKEGKAPVDIEVENALLKSALGYHVTVKKAIKVKKEMQKPGVGKVVEEHIEYIDEDIYIPPNGIAQIFWLKNRRPDRWRDHPDMPVSTEAIERLDAVLDKIEGNL